MKQLDNKCSKRIDKDFMRKIVGKHAVRNVKEHSDGCITGYILTVHLDQIMKAYRKDKHTFTSKYDIEEYFSCINTGLSYFEITL